MPILNRYIISHILLSSLGVLAVIVSIDVIFAFFDELGQVEELYTPVDALWYSVLLSPIQIVAFSVVSLLIGTLVGLGVLASNSELMVIRSAGVGMARLLGISCVAGLLFAGSSFIVAQWLVPKAALMAEQFKSEKIGYFGKRDRGVWLRDGQDFIYVNRMNAQGEIQSMTQFKIDQAQGVEITQAEKGHYLPEHSQWLLEDVKTTGVDLTSKSLYTRHQPLVSWPAKVTPNSLMLLQLKPEHLSVTGLWAYSKYLSSQSLNNERYSLMFWNLLLQPVACLIMIVLSLSMVMGSMRSVSMGYRITLGLIYGLSFYYLQEVFGFLSLLYGLHPLVSFSLPLLGFLALGSYRLSRIS